MAIAQSVYPLVSPIGIVGQIINGETSNRISRTVETAAGLKFGAPAFRGTNDHGVSATAPGATPGVAFIGLAVLDHVVPVPDAANPDRYPQYYTANLMTQGSMIVQAGAGGVADGGLVYWNIATNKYTATNTDVLIPNAYYDTTAAADALVQITLRNHN